jgi:DNA sulfur modification protein DndB
MAKQIIVPFILTQQHRKSFYLTSLSARDLIYISYVARRRVDDEVGAVQRLLNPARIAGIRDFILAGGLFPTSVVLNWTDKATAPTSKGKQLLIHRESKSSQIIDGQHRIIGLSAAIEKKPTLASFQVPVSFYSGLSTKDCADIFLSINTEQKPVHRSLVFDLYSLASDYVVDPSALRAGDLAKELNENSSSPYIGFIKFPNTPTKQKGLALSTVVSTVKPLVEEKGVFEQIGLTELQMQVQFLINFFSVLRDAYGIEWENPSNVFRTAAGFIGAIEFVKNRLIVHCNIKSDFTREAIAKVMRLSDGNLIRRDLIEGLQGRRAFTQIADALEAAFDPNEGKTRKIKV